MSESRKRSIAKSVFYRFLAILSTVAVDLGALLILTDFTIVTSIGLSLVLTITAEGLHTVLYYFNERLWNRVSWGKDK